MRRAAIQWVATVAIILALVTLAGCGTPPAATPSPSPSLQSGIRGLAMAAGGPVTSSVTPNAWPASYAAVAVHEGTLDGPVVRRATADANGRFSVELPAGAYTVVQAHVAGQPKRVTVHAGEYVRVTLWQSVP